MARYGWAGRLFAEPAALCCASKYVNENSRPERARFDEMVQRRTPKQLPDFRMWRFVEQGRRLLSAAEDRTVRVWDATPLPD